MQRIRYPALKLIIRLHYVIAALLTLGGVVAFFSSREKDPMPLLVVAGLVALVVFIVAAAESMRVFIDIEENTRALREGREARPPQLPAK
jgi:hypothetical protein